MWARILAIIKNLDWWLMLAVFLLVSIGLAELYSINGAAGGNLFNKQLIAAGVGIFIIGTMIFMDYYFFYSYSQYIYIFGALLLVAVLFFGKEVNTTKGWLIIFGQSLQPVEIAKVCLITALARFFSSANLKASTWKVIFQSALILLGYVVLVMLQPDLGSALVLAGIWSVLIVAAGLSKKIVISFILLSFLGFSAAWPFLADYQKNRILNVIQPSSASLTSDYNVNQAIIAIGSGQALGRGLGFGSQSQLRFLPEAKTDFIFAVISEELGLLGVTAVLACFAIIYYRLLANLANIKNNFGIFFVLGFLGLIFIQMFTNIGMNMGLLPVVGITLPFLSYGGSSLAANLILVGIVQSIIVRSKIKNY